MLAFDAGEVLVHGDIYDPRLPAMRSKLAAAIDSGDHFLDLTVREHLEFVARAHGDPEPATVVDRVLAGLELDRVADRFPYALSQGQRRRLGLAACFVRPHDDRSAAAPARR